MELTKTLQTFFDSIKNMWLQFDLKKWANSLGGSSSQAILAAVYFGLSFAIGYLFKKYFKFLFMSLIVAGFIIVLAHYNGLLTINMGAIKNLFGIGTKVTGGDVNLLINHFFDWVRDNLLYFISCIVGFFVGYKLG
ncbi:MAG: hypothetical protein US69_C0018G0012 [candidate division TM6 bacterium GW2011_GWF2_38_10]|nr:MAG: hypothetical protein US69_C0018G0012 [candidate division TM6 bacterium GW2011_GWF2_38_10]